MKYLVFLVLVFSSCYYDNEESLYQFVETTCDVSNVSYTTDIVPIVSASCAGSGCHNAVDKGGNIILETYAQIKLSVDGGGFLGSITHDSKYSPMPLGGTFLPQCQIDKISAWIDAGALEN